LAQRLSKCCGVPGCEVVFDERQTCCGQPAFNTGYRSEARSLARRFIEIFEGSDAVGQSFRILYGDGPSFPRSVCGR
jgi:Fe-S oxidoreductase